jgi:hypothetical protein
MFVFFFFRCLFIIQFRFFSFFFPSGGHSVHGAVLIWPRVVCGSTVWGLAHLVVCVSQAGEVLASGGMGALLVSLF